MTTSLLLPRRLDGIDKAYWYASRLRVRLSSNLIHYVRKSDTFKKFSWYDICSVGIHRVALALQGSGGSLRLGRLV